MFVTATVFVYAYCPLIFPNIRQIVYRSMCAYASTVHMRCRDFCHVSTKLTNFVFLLRLSPSFGILDVSVFCLSACFLHCRTHSVPATCTETSFSDLLPSIPPIFLLTQLLWLCERSEFWSFYCRCATTALRKRFCRLFSVSQNKRPLLFSFRINIRSTGRRQFHLFNNIAVRTWRDTFGLFLVAFFCIE